MPAFPQDFCIVRKEKICLNRWHSPRNSQTYLFHRFLAKTRESLRLVNAQVHTCDSGVQPPFCLLYIPVGAMPKWNFHVSIPYILDTENFCIYYCVCIDGIFEHSSKAIREQIGWGCAAHFLKPLPSYFRPKSVVFPTPFQTWIPGAWHVTGAHDKLLQHIVGLQTLKGKWSYRQMMKK